MSLLNYLQFQKIDDADDEIPPKHRVLEKLNLKEEIDEETLEKFWDQVVDDIRHDPDWFTFAEE